MTIRATGLADTPQQSRLNRRGGGVQVVAVQAQSGLQAQRVAGTQSDGLDLIKRQQRSGQCIRSICGDRNFEAVLSGITGAGNKAICPGEIGPTTTHKNQLTNLRGQLCHHIGGSRSLQGQQCTVLQIVDLETGQSIFQIGEILLLTSGIHHQKEAILCPAGNHQIIENTALLIGK